MKNDKARQFTYEPDADVLTWEISQGKLDYAEQVDSMIIHYDKDDKPLFVEFMEASKFILDASKILQ